MLVSKAIYFFSASFLFSNDMRISFWGIERDTLGDVFYKAYFLRPLPITIVIRPSDNRQIIVYYSSEKDMLDYENAELWIDNGQDTPRHLTLGKILKKTGITKIPV